MEKLRGRGTSASSTSTSTTKISKTSKASKASKTTKTRWSIRLICLYLLTIGISFNFFVLLWMQTSTPSTLTSSSLPLLNPTTVTNGENNKENIIAANTFKKQPQKTQLNSIPNHDGSVSLVDMNIKQQQQQQQHPQSFPKQQPQEVEPISRISPNEYSSINDNKMENDIYNDIDDDDDETFAFCLLIKDDNDILNEWIAYHYHTIKLRTIIVAIDPTSQTSPISILQTWNKYFQLQYEIWNDSDYMPEYFVRGEYDKVPRMIKIQDKDATKWQETLENVTEEHLRQDYLQINAHRFRQAKFLQACCRKLQFSVRDGADNNNNNKKRTTWMTHIDTDEYMVINPTLRKSGFAGTNGTLSLMSLNDNSNNNDHIHSQQHSANGLYGQKYYTSGYILKFLQTLHKIDSSAINWPCISMPRVLFGAVEDEDDDDKIDARGHDEQQHQDYHRRSRHHRRMIFSNDNVQNPALEEDDENNNDDKWMILDRKKFETLRWKYHVDYSNKEINKQPKVIMDVSGFPTFNITRRAFSIHRPNMKLCRQQSQMNIMKGYKYPIIVNHYLGSIDRYLSRNDPRRTQKVYYEKANVQDGKEDDDTDAWIESWLPNFIHLHGIEKVQHVLNEYTYNDNNGNDKNNKNNNNKYERIIADPNKWKKKKTTTATVSNQVNDVDNDTDDDDDVNVGVNNNNGDDDDDDDMIMKNRISNNNIVPLHDGSGNMTSSSSSRIRQHRKELQLKQDQLLKQDSKVVPLSLGRTIPLHDDSFSACLLVKDDNDILNEWIAYHYHTIKLRTIIIAIDPSSRTVPTHDVLDRWRDMIDIEEWTDESYMPDFFLQKQYHLVPNLIGNMTNSTNSQFHQHDTNVDNEDNNEINDNNKVTTNDNDNDDDTINIENTIGHIINDKEKLVQQELIQINNHRYRQSTFFMTCIQDLKLKNKTWMVHIDTDEYIVLHAQVRQQNHWRNLSLSHYDDNYSNGTITTTTKKQNKKKKQQRRRDDFIGLQKPSSILRFIKRAASTYSKAVSYPCISMPRLLFGSVEEDDEDNDKDDVSIVDNDPPSPFVKTKFETLRWKYHSDYDNDLSLNGRPKVILDLSGLPPRSNFLMKSRGVFSIHRPGLFLCRADRGVVFGQKHKFPITVNHYLGSWERYNQRTDARRSRTTYDIKAKVTAGKDDNWIDSWVEGFVHKHGLEKATELLREYVGNGTTGATNVVTTTHDSIGNNNKNNNHLVDDTSFLDGITKDKDVHVDIADIDTIDEEEQQGDDIPGEEFTPKLSVESPVNVENIVQRRQEEQQHQHQQQPGENEEPERIKPESVLNFDSSRREEFSACLLTKDDNDIMNEWIAYHYHTLGLRYLIVAVDAKSETSPSTLLDKWRKQFNMTIEEWTDDTFMPDMYFQKAYHLQPRLVKIKKNKHKWLEGIDDQKTAQQYWSTIQDHRFRQITFVSACTKRLREQNRTWMIHIDTDEYIVLNPKLRKVKQVGFESVTVPQTIGPSIVPKFLNQMVTSNWDTINYPCISLPRLMYGSLEDKEEDDTQNVRQTNPTLSFNVSRFETLRWKYHAHYGDDDVNKQPKVIMDVSVIPSNDKMLTENRVFSIHRPSQYLCRTQGQMNFDYVEYYPFTTNHYLGTFERFSSRDDPRRNLKLYNQKANVTGGKDDNWIDGWLPSFIDTHGIEKVSIVMNDYLKK